MLAFALTTSCALAQYDLDPKKIDPSKSRLEPDQTLPSDPKVTIGTLPNGLTYYIRPNHRPEGRAEIMLVVNAGSILEDPEQRGLAHFVEHMAFNGTKNFPKSRLVDYLESTGMRFGADLNAYTSFDQTVYMLQVPTDSAEELRTGFQILEDWAHNVSFDDDEIDKERGVVVEEWRLGRGAGNRVSDKQFPVLMRDSRYAERRPIGDKAVLDTFHHDVLRRFYKDWYRPELMAVIAVGDFDKEQIQKLITEHFSGIGGPSDPRPREFYPVPDHDETLFSVVTDPELTMTNIAVYTKRPPEKTRSMNEYRRDMVDELFSSMLRARLSELARRPDPPYLYGTASSGGLVRTKGMSVLSAAVADSGVERALTTLLVEATRVKRYGFTASELARQKTEMMRDMERAYAEREKTESRAYANSYVSDYLNGEPAISVDMAFQLYKIYLEGITLDEVNALADGWLGARNRVITVSGPQKAGLTIPDSTALRAVLASIDGMEITPYVDNVSNEPLLPTEPKKGRIVSERSIPELGVTEWKLSNGVRVALKPTDFKNDEVRFTSFSPGGTSLVSDADFYAAAAASDIVDESGVGTFDNVTLQKKLAGQVVSVSPYIGELREGINGSASPRDLETMFQLIYLYATAPRRDTAAFASLKSREQGALRNRSAIPEVVFDDSVRATIWNGHLRARPWDASTWDRINLDRALDIYRNRFADLGDLTFVIVGNFDSTALRPLVETYLGGLPSSGRKETWRDVGMRLARGGQQKAVRKGLEPKSAVRLYFTGDFDWNLQNRFDMQAMVEVLRIRLREALREEKGGTYSVGVNGSPMHLPKERYLMTVSFGCAPDRVDELTRTTLEQIEKLKKEGPTAEELAKVREIQRRGLETTRKQNDYWLSQLANSYVNGEDPVVNVKVEPLIEKMNAASVQNAARRYFDMKTMTTMVLVPERQ